MKFREGDKVTRREGSLVGLEAKVIDPDVVISKKYHHLVAVKFKGSNHIYRYPKEALRRVK